VTNTTACYGLELITIVKKFYRTRPLIGPAIYRTVSWHNGILRLSRFAFPA